MFVQDFIKLVAAVHELSCSWEKKLSNDAENNTAVTSAGSKNLDQFLYIVFIVLDAHNEIP